jgi:hypothetical protein
MRKISKSRQIIPKKIAFLDTKQSDEQARTQSVSHFIVTMSWCKEKFQNKYSWVDRRMSDVQKCNTYIKVQEFEFHTDLNSRPRKDHINHSHIPIYFSCVASAPHLALVTIDTATPSGGTHLQACELLNKRIKRTFGCVSATARGDTTLARILQTWRLLQRTNRVRRGYTGCPRRNVPDFGRVFLRVKHTDIIQNTYVQSWTVTKIMAREKCGLLAGRRIMAISWQYFNSDDVSCICACFRLWMV